MARRTVTQLQIASKLRKQLMAHVLYSEDVKQHDLQGFCAVGAGLLHTEFKKHGFDSKLIWGCADGHHCFVESHGVIWDITATQFWFGRNRPVLFVSKKHPFFKKNYKAWYRHHKDWYRPSLTFPRVIKHNRLSKVFDTWNDYYRPSKFLLTHIKSIKV